MRFIHESHQFFALNRIFLSANEEDFKIQQPIACLKKPIQMKHNFCSFLQISSPLDQQALEKTKNPLSEQLNFATSK